MSIILHIDTSDSNLYVSIAKQGVLLDEQIVAQENNHVALINTTIEDLLKRNKRTLKDILAVAVLNGPGSYTGLRVGLSLAKAFCIALNIPLLLSHKLELMSMCENLPARKLCIIKAMKEEYFAVLYDNKTPIFSPQIITPSRFNELEGDVEMVIINNEEIISELSINAYFLCTKAQLYSNFINKSYVQFVENQHFDISTSAPFYIKSTYIAQKL